MQFHLFTAPKAHPSYRIAILSRRTAFNKQELFSHYVAPLVKAGLEADDMLAVSLDVPEVKGSKPVPDAFAKLALEDIIPDLVRAGVTHLLVADASYFKVLTKERKAEPHLGYALPCKYVPTGQPECDTSRMQVVLSVNYQSLIYNPLIQGKLDLSLQALASSVKGSGTALGANIIHGSWYPTDTESIRQALKSLHQHPRLTCDIEAFSLKFWQAGIGTISFAWDQHHGIAFPCDRREYAEKPDEGFFGYQQDNPEVRALLREFFETYEGELIFHNAGYDVKVLVHVLWMKDLLDQEGLLQGLEVMTRDGRWHDTKIVGYLALNSTARVELGLKSLAHEFAGNWGIEEIKDIRRIPLDTLLQYNLVDSLSTWYVLNKHWPTLVADRQEPLYHELMMPSQRLIIQIELTGMPMSEARIQEVKVELQAILEQTRATIFGHPMIPVIEAWMTDRAWERDFEERRGKAVNPDKIRPKDRTTFPRSIFNPNSGPQMQALLYEFLKLPVIDKTKTGLPATGAETIEKLMDHELGQQHKALLQAFMDYAGVAKILSTYIPPFEAGLKKADDGILWLHGSFVIGVVVSGRLSSKEPNLQNIPANSIYGKLVKTIFQAPKGWIFAGADFNSLEDMISALTTKDPNKISVYTRGFDGHSLRAVYYWKEEFPGIDISDPKQVNQLKKEDHPLRQASKAPTFALTYQGTFRTLMTNLGWSMAKAKAVESNYHELYKASDAYVQERIKRACKDGFVEVAFGFRIRTPLLSQVVYGAYMPGEAAQEARTIGNALGQSWGLLNNRAAVAFWLKVWKHSEYRTKVLPCALIHDAIYALIKDDLKVVAWVNKHLIQEMRWQDHPEIAHDEVKLGAALDLFWPDWSKKVTLPNDADPETILKLVKEHRAEVSQPKELKAA